MATTDRDEVDISVIKGLFTDMGPDIKLIIGLVAFTLLMVYMPVLNETFLRVIPALILVVFAPGYSMIAALFPGKGNIGWMERIALSVGLSIAVTPLIGLALNFTSFGVRLDPLIACISAFTLVCALIANLRRQGMPQGERLQVDFKAFYKASKNKLMPGNSTGMDRMLTALLLCSMALAGIVMLFAVVAPTQGESFTELYILGPDGKMAGYPLIFNTGDTKPVTLGVVNHERRVVDYDLVVMLSDNVTSTRLYSERITMGHNDSFKKTLNITPDREGSNMKLEFLLYADGNMTAPYRNNHIWINVTSRS